jgi:hypothetical protein
MGAASVRMRLSFGECRSRGDFGEFSGDPLATGCALKNVPF